MTDTAPVTEQAAKNCLGWAGTRVQLTLVLGNFIAQNHLEECLTFPGFRGTEGSTAFGRLIGFERRILSAALRASK